MALTIQRRDPGVSAPRYRAKEIPPVVDSHGLEVGSAIISLGKDVSRFSKAMKVTRQNMELADAESSLFVEFSNYEDELENATDYKQLESSHPDYIADVQKRFSEQLSHDPEIQATFQPYLNKKIAVLNSRVRAKSRGLQIDEGRATLNSTLEKMEYGLSSLDDASREEAVVITKKAIDNAVAGGLITRQEGQQRWDALEESSEAVRASRWMDVDPEKAKVLIAGNEFKVSPDKKEALLNAADVAIKQKEREAKAVKLEAKLKEKEFKEEAAKQEDTNISKLYRDRKLTQAVAELGKVKFMEGGKIKVWTDALNTALKDAPIDKNLQTVEILKINDMISRKEDPDKINDFITTNKNLSFENKEQYLTKLETKQTAEITDGRNKGYKIIQDLIIPKRGMFEKLLQTPLETQAVVDAQLALDTWIDEQIKNKKPPSSDEIRKKAMNLSKFYQPGIADKVNYTQQEAVRQAEEMKRRKEKATTGERTFMINEFGASRETP